MAEVRDGKPRAEAAELGTDAVAPCLVVLLDVAVGAERAEEAVDVTGEQAGAAGDLGDAEGGLALELGEDAADLGDRGGGLRGGGAARVAAVLGLLRRLRDCDVRGCGWKFQIG